MNKLFINKNEVDLKAFGKFLFSNPKQLNFIDNLIAPYIREWIISLPNGAVVEMAAFINNESLYHDLFDYKIMITRAKNDYRKLDYLNIKNNPIKNNVIDIDFIIENNGNPKNLKNKR